MFDGDGLPAWTKVFPVLRISNAVDIIFMNMDMGLTLKYCCQRIRSASATGGRRSYVRFDNWLNKIRELLGEWQF